MIDRIIQYIRFGKWELATQLIGGLLSHEAGNFFQRVDEEGLTEIVKCNVPLSVLKKVYDKVVK